MKLRIYTDTSVIGGCIDPEFQVHSSRLVEKFKLSWNFKHIVNRARIRGYNSINLRQGYPVLEIRSPMEVFANEKS